MKGKQGQLGNLPGTVMLIVFSLIMLVVGFMFVQTIFDFDELTDESATITNETIRLNSSNPDTLDAASILGFNSPVAINLNNETGGETLALGNITINNEGVVKNTSAFTSDNVNITYSYMYGRSSLLGVNSTLESFSDIPNMMGLLILIIMVGIVIAVVVGIGGKTGTGA